MLLYFVFKKNPFADVWSILKTGNIAFLALALILFALSQFFSAERLGQYFGALQFNLQKNENRKLYLIGMFYNFFIPGGIGGDAYKVYVLHKKYDWGVKKLSAAVLADRLSGLLAILVLIQLLGISFLPANYKFLIVVSVALTLFLAGLAFTAFFPSFKIIFIRTLLFSFLIQGLQLAAIFCIVSSFAAVADIGTYFLVFLLSTVLSVLSFSGIGIREWVFMKAGYYLHYDVRISVATAMIFTLLTALVSLFGIYFQLTQNGVRSDVDSKFPTL